MKILRRLAWVSIVLIFASMVITLFQFQDDKDASLLQDQVDYYYNENWVMISLDSKSTNLSGTEQEKQARIQKLIRNELNEGDFKKVSLPYSGKSRADDIVVFRNTFSDDYVGQTFEFSSIDVNVHVFFDGELIYQYEIEEDDASQKTNEKKEHYVSIPYEFQEGELWIELTSSYADAAAKLGDIKFAVPDGVVIGVVGNKITDIGCCLLIVIMSIIMFVLMMIRRYTLQPDRGELFIGLAGLFAGLYCFIGTDTLSIFYDIHAPYVMQEYLVLLIIMFLTLYFEWNMYTIFPRRFSVLLCVMIINAVGQLFLDIFGVYDLAYMTNISAAAMVVICVTAFVSLMQFYKNIGFYQTLLSGLSIFALLSGGIANMIMNMFMQYSRENIAGQYSMTVFSIMSAIVHTMQLSKEYRAAAEKNARLFEEKAKIAQQQNILLEQAKQEADAARHEALAANEAKGKFLAHMSHEIRTPINAVLGMDEMILRESGEKNIKDYAMDIYTAGQTLLALINDILDFSKIDSGKMEIVPVEYDVCSMIHDLSNMTSQRAEDKNIKLEVDVDSEIPSRLFGDDVRIRQVLTNLLTNAVKYTHEGTVWLRVKLRKSDEVAVIRFEVEDTGIGIKEEDLPKLTAEFERIEEDRNRNIEGTGLGMSITIQLLALLGSRLLVESTYGKGSKFYFDLEQKIIDYTSVGDFRSRVSLLSEKYDYNSKFCAPDAKILVVDDNAVNRKVLRNLLKETKLQVTDVASGIECLELVQKNHYDLIFLDHMMPEMDGIEILHHIKELPDDCPCKNTPIVVLTANAVSGAKEKYLSEGFDAFLSKPVVPEKLENMIVQMLPRELLQEVSADESEMEIQQVKSSVSEDLPEELPFVDGLDWNYAWMHLPDMELLEYTVKEFYSQIDSAADNLERSYERITEPEQLDNYRIQVHAMKSLAATVGIVPLSGVAKILEYAAKDGKIDVITSITDTFLEEWRSYHQKLKNVFGIGDIKGQEITDYSVILALIEMLRLSMQEMDIDQADQLIKRLQEYEYPEEMRQDIQSLAEAVTNLDSDEINHIADLLIEKIEV